MYIDSISGSFRQLLGNGNTHEIPKFQRDYSWENENWENLWDDILLLLEDAEESADHYMGYLVCQTKNNKHFIVIDGQQRITTISLIILAAIAYLEKIAESAASEQEKEANLLRAKTLRDRYIGELNTRTLVTINKLTLNRNDDPYYKDYLVPLQDMPIHGVPASALRLHRAFRWFLEKIVDYSQGDGQKTATIIDAVTDKLFFTVIKVADEVNAYNVFETLNARAMRLSSADLLKNHLFAMAHRASGHEIDNMERLWERLVSSLGDETVSSFLRVYWNSQHKLARKSQLFKVIKSEVKTADDSFALLRGLDNALPVHVGLRNPMEVGVWNAQERKALNTLKTFGEKQHLSLLLSCHARFFQNDRTGFLKILKLLVALTFRYNIICGLNPNEQESAYNKIAHHIANDDAISVAKVAEQLKRLSPTDETFTTAFSEMEFDINNSRNRRILRYILFQMEKKLSGLELDIADDLITIEHICPQSSDDSSWDMQTAKHVHRIGNTTLLKFSDNRDGGNLPYTDKLSIYRKSEFIITNKIPEHYLEWNVAKIDSRQQQMAKQAASIWNIQ